MADFLGGLNVFEELLNLLEWIKDRIIEGISCVFQKAQSFFWNIYNVLRKKLSSTFEHASPWCQNRFIAVTDRVNKEIVTLESKAGKILKDLKKYNCCFPNTVVDGKTIGDTEYANSIFRNAKIESALQNGMKNKDNGNLHPVTSDLLDISSSLAKILEKTSLEDHQHMFEALSIVVKEEYKRKIQTYIKMLAAAKSGAGHQIDIEAFNRSLGIKGDVKEYYWHEAMTSVMEPRLANLMKEKMENLEKQNKLLILPLSKQDEDAIAGVYRLVGVHGANKFTAKELINALKETQFDFQEGELVIKETSSGMIIVTKDLTLAAVQELNTENTSLGMLLVMNTEDLKKED